MSLLLLCAKLFAESNPENIDRRPPLHERGTLSYDLETPNCAFSFVLKLLKPT